MNPQTLDHVALWVPERDRIVDFATSHLGMHVIERTERFTLIGSDARRGKLTLFAADGPRDSGALGHIALRVSDLARARAGLPAELELDEVAGGVYFEVVDGLRLGLVEAATDTEYDLDHVALRSSAPAASAAAYRPLGFAPAAPGPGGAPRVEVGGAYVEFHPGGDGAEPERPLLNHLAVLVDSAHEHIADAEELGVEIADVVDAPNTYAVFVWGPERVKIEYVEHKPTFSLT